MSEEIVAIVGAGQAGADLAAGLRQQNHAGRISGCAVPQVQARKAFVVASDDCGCPASL